MKRTLRAGSLLILMLGPLCLAQTWEVGGAGAYGLYHNVTATSTAGSTEAGFASSAAVSATLTSNQKSYFGGEARYVYSFSGLKVGSATMGGDSHAFTYEVLVYGNKRGSAVRPFFAAGAGGKFYRGTGPETTSQPGSAIAVMTRTSEFQPVISFGGGVKAAVGKHGLFRVDFRDHTSPFPTKVIAPRPPSGTVGGWLHQFLIMAGISVTF